MGTHADSTPNREYAKTTSPLSQDIRRGAVSVIVVGLVTLLILIAIDVALITTFVGNINEVTIGVIVVVLFFVVLMCLCIWFLIISGIKDYRNPLRSRTLKSLRRYGDQEKIAREIDADLLEEHQEIEGMHLTKNWLICLPVLMRREDVVWIYNLVNSQGGAKSYGVVIRDSYGGELTRGFGYSGKSRAADAFQDLVAYARPGLVGYDTFQKDAYKSIVAEKKGAK